MFQKFLANLTNSAKITAKKRSTKVMSFETLENRIMFDVAGLATSGLANVALEVGHVGAPVCSSAETMRVAAVAPTSTATPVALPAIDAAFASHAVFGILEAVSMLGATSVSPMQKPYSDGNLS